MDKRDLCVPMEGNATRTLVRVAYSVSGRWLETYTSNNNSHAFAWQQYAGLPICFGRPKTHCDYENWSDWRTQLLVCGHERWRFIYQGHKSLVLRFPIRMDWTRVHLASAGSYYHLHRRDTSLDSRLPNPLQWAMDAGWFLWHLHAVGSGQQATARRFQSFCGMDVQALPRRRHHAAAVPAHRRARNSLLVLNAAFIQSLKLCFAQSSHFRPATV